MAKLVTVRWTFSQEQHAQLTEIMLRAAAEGKLEVDMISNLYDWHLCASIDLDVNLVDTLLSYTDDMLCDYVGLNSRAEDNPDEKEYYERYKTDYALQQDYCNLNAVEQILKLAKEQLETKDMNQEASRKHDAVSRLATTAAQIDEAPYQECYDEYARMWDEAEKSYEGTNWEKRYCNRCGMLMVAGSMAYEEGWHFDTCL